MRIPEEYCRPRMLTLRTDQMIFTYMLLYYYKSIEQSILFNLSFQKILLINNFLFIYIERERKKVRIFS